MTELMRSVSYVLFGLFIMDLSLQSIKTDNWSVNNFKKHFISMTWTLEPTIQAGDIGQWIPLLTAVS